MVVCVKLECDMEWVFVWVWVCVICIYFERWLVYGFICIVLNVCIDGYVVGRGNVVGVRFCVL